MNDNNSNIGMFLMRNSNNSKIHLVFSRSLGIYLQDIKKSISNVENLIVHSHCLQFRIKIRNFPSSSHENGNVHNNNNYNDETIVSTPAVIDDGMVLSDLFNKLYALTVGRGITFTLTECLLDQVSTDHSKSMLAML